MILADDLIDAANKPAMQQMTELFNYYQCSILGVQQVAREETGSYGIVATQQMNATLGKVERIVEKPAPAVAPSTLGVVGRYILTPRIFNYLETIPFGAGGELQLTDAIAQLLHEQQVLAYSFDGIRYDCGSKMGYLKATVEHALQHREVGKEFREYLDKYCQGLVQPE